MTRSKQLPILLTALLSLTLCFAAETQPTKVTTANLINSDDVLAEYDGGMITREELDTKISKLPPNAQGRYKTVEGQIQVLDIMAVEAAFMQKALQLEMDKDPEVVQKIEAGADQFLLQEFYKRNISDLLVITEADKQKYYDDNKQAFYLYPNLTIKYIQAADEASAQKALKELKDGTPFATVSDKYNTNTYAKGLKGVIKNIRLNGNIPGVGNDLELEQLISEAVTDTTSFHGPIQTGTGWHVFTKQDHVPGRQKSFQEVLPELEHRTRPGVESRMLDDLTDNLKLKYKVVTDSTLVNQIDLGAMDKNAAIESQILVSSPDPQLNITIADVLASFKKLSPQEQMFITKGEGPKQLVNQELVRRLLTTEAKAQNYTKYLQDNDDFQQMKRYYILNTTFRKLVSDSLQVSSEDARAYYDEHLDDFTTPANRSIQVLWFKNEKDAKKALKSYNKYVKKNNEKAINELIEKKSEKPKLALLDNIYHNGIITGIGPDKDFNNMVWDNPIGWVSPVFKTSRGDIVFFRILKETPPLAQSFTDIEPRIYGTLKREREAARQEEVTQQLFTEFNMVKYPERVKLELSAEELFNLADNAARQRNFRDSITYYDQIIANYANGADDYRASFMKAFTVAEELKDEARAIQLFGDFLKKYPSGELNESAQFMLDSLQGRIPEDIIGE
jgi:hypothetical protein